MSKRFWSTVDERKAVVKAMEFVQLACLVAPFVQHNDRHSYAAGCLHSDFTFYLMFHTLTLMLKVTTPLEDTTIPFHLPAPVLADFNESHCVDHFRFRKADLRDLLDELLPRLLIFLPEDSTEEKVKCENKYVCHYETGVLCVLARLSRPRRLRPELEKMFRTKRHDLTDVSLFNGRAPSNRAK